MAEDLKRRYDRLWASGWDQGASWLPIKKTQYRLTYQLLKKFPPQGDVMDIGGGNAAFWSEYRHHFVSMKTLTITDISKYALEKAKQSGFDVWMMDVTSPHLNMDKTYQSICCFEVLEHIYDDVKAIANCFKLLSPGGYLLISVPHAHKYWSRSDEQSLHVRRYEKQEMREKLNKAGFDVVQLYTWGGPIFRWYQQAKNHVRPEIGQKQKDRRAMQILSKGIYAFFRMEDWWRSRDGQFMYVVAKRPMIVN